VHTGPWGRLGRATREYRGPRFGVEYTGRRADRQAPPTLPRSRLRRSQTTSGSAAIWRWIGPGANGRAGGFERPRSHGGRRRRRSVGPRQRVRDERWRRSWIDAAGVAGRSAHASACVGYRLAFCMAGICSKTPTSTGPLAGLAACCPFCLLPEAAMFPITAQPGPRDASSREAGVASPPSTERPPPASRGKPLTSSPPRRFPADRVLGGSCGPSGRRAAGGWCAASRSRP